jgi:Protein of unknown function (DUF2924)
VTFPKEISAALAESRRSMAPVIAELRGLTVAQLVARYEEVWGAPPRVKHKAFLWKRIAWKLQEARTGGLSALAKARLEKLMAEIDLPLEDRSRTISGALARTAPRRAGLPPGSTLTRLWRDQEIRVRVLDDGQFEWSGVPYRSLTAVAKAVTGAHWNGRLFFGLANGKEAKA